MVTMAPPRQRKFAFRDGGMILCCFMVPRTRRSKRQAPTSPSTSSSSSKENFFSSDNPDGAADAMFLKKPTIQNDVPARSHSGSNRDAATAPLLNAEATEESFVFSPSTLPLESPSFRKVSDPLLSTFSYSCAPGTTPNAARTSKFGGRPHPLPPPASPFRMFGSATMPVWLPLPEPTSSELRSTSGASSFVSTSSSSEGRVVASNEGGIGSWSVRRGKVKPMGGLPLPSPSVATKLLPGLESFEFQDLKCGARGFAAECCMEKGEFGAVYRARIKSTATVGRDLAVVRLNVDENQSLEDWRTDVQMLSQLSDSNICVVKGYCAHEEADGTGRVSSERLLVFEQSPNGNLHDYLCGSRSKTQLDWPARISIVLGAARGLLYLHDRAPFQIVYREFRSSSVLLDKDYTPRLAGYGLAVTSSPSDKRSSFTSVMKRSQAHARSNMWSFGIVLVELLTGKFCRDAIFQCDERSFVQWAAPFLKDESKLALILDTRMKGKCPVKGAFELAKLALQCLKKKQGQRPSMARVVDTLKSIKESFGGRLELGSTALLLQWRAPSFEGVSSEIVDPKLLLMDSGSSEDENSRASTCATQTGKSFEDFETARAHSPGVF